MSFNEDELTRMACKHISPLEVGKLQDGLQECLIELSKKNNEANKPTRKTDSDLVLYKTLLNTFYVYCGLESLNPDEVGNYVTISLKMHANQEDKTL